MSERADYKVGAVVRGTDLKSTVGLAWNQPDGTIRVKLFSFVHLPVATPDLFITLFPNDGQDYSKNRNLLEHDPS